jgi:hypothetical protein
MENEKKQIEKLAKDIVENLPRFCDCGECPDSQEELEIRAVVTLSEALLSHGQSCYEKGRAEEQKKVCGSKHSYVCQVESQQKELTTLKAKAEKLVEALGAIANIDYRGNRSYESHIAFEALKTWNE